MSFKAASLLLGSARINAAVIAVSLSWSGNTLAQGQAKPQAASPERIDEAEPPSGEEAVVYVQGGKLRQAADPTLASSVMQGEELDAAGGDLALVVDRAPGAQVTRSGGSSELATLSIRGSDADQVPVYLSGIYLNDDVVGLSDLSSLPLHALGRVELYRGAVPAHLPHWSMAGGLLLEPALGAKNLVLGGVEYGSFSSQRLWTSAQVSSTNSATTTEPPQVKTSLSYERRASKNNYRFKTDGGTAFDERDDGVVQRQNADFQSDDLWVVSRLKLGSSKKATRVSLISNLYQREQGVSSLALVQTQSARETYRRALFGTEAKIPLAQENVEQELKLNASLLLARRATDDPQRELNLSATSLFQRGERLTTQVGYQARVSDDWLLSSSAVYERAHLGLSEPKAERVNAQANFITGALSMQWFVTAESLVLLAGRMSCFDSRDQTEVPLDEQSSNQSECNPEGRLGMQTYLAGIEWRGNISRVQRYPTLAERYGVSATVRGNAKLESESGWSADAGGRWQKSWSRLGSLSVESFAFSRWTKNLITFERASLGYIRPYNEGKARFFGLESAVATDLFQHLRGKGQVTLLSALATEKERPYDNSEVPYRSPYTLSSLIELYLRGHGSSLVHELALGLQYDGKARKYADRAGLIKIPAMHLFELLARAEFFAGALKARLRVSNLGNARAFDVLGYPLPGRAVYGSLEGTLE